MWTAKYTSGGFSVNFFWPTSAPEKVNVQSKKKRKHKRKSKAKTVIVLSSSSLTSQQPAAVIAESQSTEKSDLFQLMPNMDHLQSRQLPHSSGLLMRVRVYRTVLHHILDLLHTKPSLILKPVLKFNMKVVTESMEFLIMSLKRVNRVGHQF